MADIARAAGVSVSTVSRALSGSSLVASAKVAEIHRLAMENGYVVNSTARNLRLKRTQTIGVVIPLGHESGQPLTDPFFSQMLGHLADEITQHGYGMFLQKVLPPMKDWLPRLVASGRADGFIVIGQSTEHKALEAMAPQYLPLVVWGGHTDPQSYCTVGTDNRGGARLATEHLLRLGRRRIVFLGDTSMPEIRLRHEGYAAALTAAAKLHKGVAAPRTVPAHLTADTAYEAVRALLAEGTRLDGLVCATDVIAISAIRAVTAAGLTVPGDVAVVGYDDIVLAAHANPALTTIRQDLPHGARMLVDLLFRRLEGEDTPSATMPAELVIRESCGGERARS